MKQLSYDTAKIVKVEYNDQELIKHIKEAKSKTIGLEFKELDFIEDIESNVPLFVRDGIILKWAHKSLQDYFAADYISTSKDKEKIIELIYSSEKDNYLNILDFLYEVEYKVFRKIIIKNILKDFITYCDESYLEIKEISNAARRERQSISYGISYGLYHSNSKEFDFDDLEKEFNGKIAELNKRIISRTNSGNDSIFQIFESGYSLQIIDLLITKNEPIFNNKKVEEKYAIREKIRTLPKDTPICLNEDPLNIINLKKNFQLFNNAIILEKLERSNSGKLYVLDYDKCKKLLMKIELEETFDESKDNLKGI